MPTAKLTPAPCRAAARRAKRLEPGLTVIVLSPAGVRLVHPAQGRGAARVRRAATAGA